ncbi:MAG: 4Fe-4S binding protein, partial [Thermoplasmata archaeon]
MADKYMGYEDLPPMPVCTFSAKEVSKTGAWRAQRPKFIKEKCIKCYICWKFCPEPSISIAKDGYIE